MSLLDRLSRLARSEVSHLRERVRRAVDRRAGGGDRGPDPAEDEGEVVEIDDPPPPPAWPREIREAYATLELPLGSDREAARKAYKRLMRIHHPDRHQQSEAAEDAATERTLKIKAAWERLDRFLAERAAPR